MYLSLVAFLFQGMIPAESAASVPTLSASDSAAIMRAAGAKLVAGKWVICAGEPNPEGAIIEQVGDFNRDGKPDAIVSERGTYCYGAAGQGFRIVSKQVKGWRVIASGAGIPQFVGVPGIDGWPDLSIGGPGTCFPVQFWNKQAFSTYRYAYEGKPCLPNR